jgi:hypothetical protein
LVTSIILSMETLLKESVIKAALIDRLVEKGMLENAVLINEMVVANWSRRVDLAVANGNLHAYEIKSDVDTLKRLDGQLEAYLARFDKTTVVCAQRFTADVLKRTPTFVEVLEVNAASGRVNFRVARRGAMHPIRDKSILIAFLLKSEIATLVNNQTQSCSRRELEVSAMEISVVALRKYVLDCLKRRYSSTSSSFLRERETRSFTTISDLEKLSRAKHGRSRDSVSVRSTESSRTPCREDVHSINWDGFAARFGCAPDDAPSYVLKRKF